MPLVHLQRDPQIVNDRIVKEIADALPAIVATALDVPENPDARLTANDIEVLIRDKHYLDVNTPPLSVIVYAQDFPERKKSLNDRRIAIAGGIRMHKPTDIHGFVWIFLGDTSYGEF